MKNKKEKSKAIQSPIELEIISHTAGDGNHRLGHSGDSSTFFEPQPEHINQTPTSQRETNSDPSISRPKTPAPEKKLTLFALQLAVLEKTASGLGKLGFVWATVVLLGGFAVFLEPRDFWFVTVILVSEGARIFSRSRELEWQHESTWTLAGGGRYSFRLITSSSRFVGRVVKALCNPVAAVQPERDSDRQIKEDAHKAKEFQKKLIRYRTQRAWHGPEVPLLPNTGWIFLSKNIGRSLSWLQIISAIACITLSLVRLVKQDYGGELKDSPNAQENRTAALNLFYALALAEAGLFLLEKAYWTWKISLCKLLDRVNQECELGADGLVSIRRFFYDAYSQCINRSIFDGIKMDLVTFAQDLLHSDFLDEQLMGVKILQRFVMRKTFAFETLRKIGTNSMVIERLIEMLNWKNHEEAEVRKGAAEIVSKLAGRLQNALRVAGIPGAMESISSLLYKGDPDSGYDYLGFNLLGLLILKKLAGDHDNCFKIGNSRGLLSRIIEFTSASQDLLRNMVASDSNIRAVKRSLQVVKMLATATGRTGKTLRQEITEIVFTISNMRNILQYGERRVELQKLAIDILTGLAMDEVAKERIAATGGVIRLLLSLFLTVDMEGQSSVRSDAGEAIAMLALENEKNCSLILKKANLGKIVAALDDPVVRLNGLRILVNLCAYCGSECSGRLTPVVSALPFVLKATMEEKDKLLEESIGLTTQICKLTGPDYFMSQLQQVCIKESDYVKTLVNILKENKYPEIKVPRIRRFVIQQSIWMMKYHRHYIDMFKSFEMEKLLVSVDDTTSDLECYHVFSGSVGLSRHRRHVSSLVDDALELLAGGSCEDENNN